MVSHSALVAELGAAQVALSLAAALRARGHEAMAWSPEPLPAGTAWWNTWRRQRRAIERFAAAAGAFDAIDTPAITASRVLARHGALVVRSTQPELLYLSHGVRGELRRNRSAGALCRAALAAPQARAILAGWRRAQVILCLGSQELAWMRRRFPRWSGKLGRYFNALPDAERPALAEVRRHRETHASPGVRFLWIGRWAPHKGIWRLMRFMAERLAAAPQDVFTVAGCGPLAERDLPAAWLGGGRVRIVPSFTRGELPALLAAHQAGLFTSDLEGWGLSLNEMLESGMTVFATEAGAVRDLRPFFPSSLRPFPPPPGAELAASLAQQPLEDLAANGYYRWSSWAAIARCWERQVLGGGEGEP